MPGTRHTLVLFLSKTPTTFFCFSLLLYPVLVEDYYIYIYIYPQSESPLGMIVVLSFTFGIAMNFLKNIIIGRFELPSTRAI